MVGNPQMEDVAKLTKNTFTKDTGIKVNFTVLPENELRDKVTQDIATQAGQYDVATIGAYEVPIWEKNGWLHELDSYADKDTGFDKADLLKPMVQPADVVFDCVARERSMAQATDLVAKGHIVVVGVGAAGTTPIRLDLIQDRELRIEGTLMYTAEDYRAALSLIVSGAVDTDEIVTATYALEDAAQAFAAATDPQHVKVLVTVDGP